MQTKTGIKSPLKWAGGKAWLAPTIRSYWEQAGSPRYVAPFCGGCGDVLGVMPDRALLNDLNPHLIRFWRWLQNDGKMDFEIENTEANYYALRKVFNALKWPKVHCDHQHWLAQAFWWLNRLGYNGMYRENGAGEMNIPYGKYKNFWMPDWRECHDTLRSREWGFVFGHYRDLPLESGDFLYLDPPYDGTFTGYTANSFSWRDQVELAHWAAGHDGPIAASNSASDRVQQLYKDLGFEVQLIDNRGNRLNCNGSDRGKKVEMLAVRGFSG